MKKLILVLLAALLAMLFWPGKTRPQEDDNKNVSFQARILECYDGSVLVEPTDKNMCNRISFSTAELEDIGAGVGDLVEVNYTGQLMESYPAQIVPISWKLLEDVQETTYMGDWLDKDTAQFLGTITADIYITEISSDHFLGEGVAQSGTYRVNGIQSADWCVGDSVHCQLDSAFQDGAGKVEGDLVSIEIVPNLVAAAKPVIYLYPQERTEVAVKLDFDGRLTCTYPAYENVWNVTAEPDGTLTDVDGMEYNYLYWEGETTTRYDLSKGFCIAGADTAAFLEKALPQLGLNRREANEFIVYWLPLMEDNPYNIISFQTDCYTDSARLDIEPAPDTLIRVFMAWQASDSFAKLEPQTLSAPERTGFTVIEWGGAEIS